MTNNVPKVPKNNMNGQKISVRPQSQKSVMILKLIILAAILLIPLTFIIFDLIHSFSILKKPLPKQTSSLQNLNQTGGIGNEFNFQTTLPNSASSDLSKVSKEKIDTLFKNLKK